MYFNLNKINIALRYSHFLLRVYTQKLFSLNKTSLHSILPSGGYHEELLALRYIVKQWTAKDIKLEQKHMGVPSKYASSRYISIKRIIKRTGISHTYGSLLLRLIRKYKPSQVIELGSSAGISTLYLAKADKHIPITTIDAHRELQQITQKNFKAQGIPNVKFVEGFFNDKLLPVIQNTAGDQLIFIDGDHSYTGTLKYFELCCAYANSNTILVFDDINWSAGMRKAWKKICSNSSVSLCINTFFMGIVFFNPDFPKREIKYKL